MPSPQSKPKTAAASGGDVDGVKIRRARKDEAAAIADLIVRTKRLNNEFDPHFAVVADAQKRAAEYVASTMASDKALLLVAVQDKKVQGVLRAELRQRLFYEPESDGRITDFYILPEFRRKALGNEILEVAVAELTKMGAGIVTAEVPSLNEIAVKFYGKRGYRPLLNIFAKKSQ